MEKKNDFLDDFKVLRAYFKNEKNYSKIHDDTFKISVRKSRLVKYKTFKNGKLVTKYLEPNPFFVFSFIRNDKVLNFEN